MKIHFEIISEKEGETRSRNQNLLQKEMKNHHCQSQETWIMSRENFSPNAMKLSKHMSRVVVHGCQARGVRRHPGTQASPLGRWLGSFGRVPGWPSCQQPPEGVTSASCSMILNPSSRFRNMEKSAPCSGW